MLLVNAEEQGSQVQQRMSEKGFYQLPSRRPMEEEGASLGVKEKRLKELIVKKEKRKSQEKDRRTFEGNSHGGDLSTPKTNIQGEDPKNLQRTSGKVASSEEVEGKEVEEKEEEKR